MLNIKQIARKLANADGAEIAEAALVLPLVFMLLLGIVWFGRAFNIYSTISRLRSRERSPRRAGSCATCSEMTPTNNALGAATAVIAVMNASNLDPTQIQAWQPSFFIRVHRRRHLRESVQTRVLTFGSADPCC